MQNQIKNFKVKSLEHYYAQLARIKKDTESNAKLTDDEKKYLILGGAVASHLTIGTWIRNTWNMWGDNSPIKDCVIKKTELLHPDDISNYILEEYIKYLNSK